MIFISTEIVTTTKTTEKDLSIIEQLMFFLPLGTTSLLISVTHSLFNAAIARLPSPEIYLSAFTVAKSLLQIIQNPVAMVRQTVTALVKDSKSYFRVRKFILILIASVVLFFTVFAFSGASRWVFDDLMGLEGQVLAQAVIILRVFILFPAAVTLRNFMQGIAIKLRKNPLVTVSTLARVSFVAILVMLVDKLTFIPPGILAGLMFLGAISIEALTMFLGIKLPTKNIPAALDKVRGSTIAVDRKEITNRVIMTFFTPLVLTSFIRALARPIIDSGLARTMAPEIAISAYAVAWSLGFIIVSPLIMFHQVPLNYIERDYPSTVESVKKFAFYLSMTLSLIVGFISFTPIGYYILRNWIGVTKEIGLPALDVLRIMSLYPLVMVMRQYYWGILMKDHKTKYISFGKFVNLVALLLTITIMTLINPPNPAIVGIIGMISAEAFESLFLYYVDKKTVPISQ